MKKANYYYDLYQADEIELEPYRDNWPSMNENLKKAMDLVYKAQTATTFWQVAEIMTTVAGIFAYISKR
jgi:hypothetical protein